jgi:hypothetical protein
MVAGVQGIRGLASQQTPTKQRFSGFVLISGLGHERVRFWPSFDDAWFVSVRSITDHVTAGTVTAGTTTLRADLGGETRTKQLSPDPFICSICSSLLPCVVCVSAVQTKRSMNYTMKPQRNRTRRGRKGTDQGDGGDGPRGQLHSRTDHGDNCIEGDRGEEPSAKSSCPQIP